LEVSHKRETLTTDGRAILIDTDTKPTYSVGIETLRARYYTDFDVFYEDAQPLLESKAVLYGQMLDVVARVREDPGTFGESPPKAWLLVSDKREPVAAAVRTPPYSLQVTTLNPAACDLLSEAILKDDPDVPGVLGPAEHARALAAALSPTRGPSKMRLEMTLYCLNEVAIADEESGALQVCTPEDFQTVYPWLCQFADDCNLPEGHPPPKRIQDALTQGRFRYWIVDKQAVGLVQGIWIEAIKMTRISAVYTPKNLRGRGYGTSATAALCREYLNRGARHITLYADTSNPTSNSIYTTIGFRKVETIQLLEFGE
jgi:predicted GNAT family acetyltransferase